MYKIISKENGKFGLQRVGSNEVHGNFENEVEAIEAAAESVIANKSSVADASQY
jgi:hypothetical protein